MDHVADQYRRVARSFTELVEGVSLDDWDRPSPCEGWTARDVVGHLAEWVPAFFADAGGPTLSTGPSVDIDPVGAWHSLDTGIQDVLDQPALAAREINHQRVGQHRFDEAIGRFVLGDVLVHTWDIGRATGQDVTLDPAVVHDMLAGMEPLDDVLRSSGQYGPRVEVPADADEQTRLLAFTGRRP